jgi:hypothetical protein
MRARSDIIIAATVALLSAAAPAQSASQAAGESGAGSPQTDLQNKKGDLSEKLNQSRGVIHPEKGVDPEMEKKAPAVGDTPVIKPPGAPGSGTTAQPK